MIYVRYKVVCDLCVKSTEIWEVSMWDPHSFGAPDGFRSVTTMNRELVIEAKKKGVDIFSFNSVVYAGEAVIDVTLLLCDSCFESRRSLIYAEDPKVISLDEFARMIEKNNENPRPE